jgi:4-hydroxy-tetrahydrodipicolinate synthase
MGTVQQPQSLVQSRRRIPEAFARVARTADVLTRWLRYEVIALDEVGYVSVGRDRLPSAHKVSRPSVLEQQKLATYDRLTARRSHNGNSGEDRTMTGRTCNTISRRQFVAGSAASVFAMRGFATGAKPMRGVFIIMATPYTETKSIDFEDLSNEVDFLDRCGVQGIVWPQFSSEYPYLTKEERMEGMRVLAKSAKQKRPALVLGVQGANTDLAVEYARAAEKLEPDAMIAMPPTEAQSLNDFRVYYRALAAVTKRPIFIQTTGGAKNITPDLALLKELARDFPNLGYMKEENQPVIERMTALAQERPTIKSVFSGTSGKGMMYEMRLGFDGTMPGAPVADIYARIWNLYQSGKHDDARDLFGKLLLVLNLDSEISGWRQYLMKSRGVFKTTVSRQSSVQLSPEAIAEIEFTIAAVRPYFTA